MKRLFLSAVFFLFPLFVSAQYPNGYYPEFFFGRQPSARAEAMGRAYVAMDGDLQSVFFNPAGTATIDKFQIYTSYTPPGYYSTKGFYTFFAIGGRIKPYLNITLSRFGFDYGKTYLANVNDRLYEDNYSINMSSKIFKNFLVGFNVNYFHTKYDKGKSSGAYYGDIGFLKKISINTSLVKNLSLGARVYNLTSSRMNTKEFGIQEKIPLPIIANAGFNIEAKIGKVNIVDSVSLFKLLLQSEYQLVINSKYRTGIKVGAEIGLFNLLFLRWGFYREKLSNIYFPSIGKDWLEAVTFGIGIQVPIFSFARLPFTLNFDFSHLPQIDYTHIGYNWPNFSTYSLRLNYHTINK